MKRPVELALEEHNTPYQVVPHHLLLNGRWVPLAHRKDITTYRSLSDFTRFLATPLENESDAIALMTADFSLILVRTATVLLLLRDSRVRKCGGYKQRWYNQYSSRILPATILAEHPSIRYVPFDRFVLDHIDIRLLSIWIDGTMNGTKIHLGDESSWFQWHNSKDFKMVVTLRMSYTREEDEAYQAIVFRKYLVLSAIFASCGVPLDILRHVFDGVCAFVWLHDYVETERVIRDKQLRDEESGRIDLVKLLPI